MFLSHQAVTRECYRGSNLKAWGLGERSLVIQGQAVEIHKVTAISNNDCGIYQWILHGSSAHKEGPSGLGLHSAVSHSVSCVFVRVVLNGNLVVILSPIRAPKRRTLLVHKCVSFEKEAHRNLRWRGDSKKSFSASLLC